MAKKMQEIRHELLSSLFEFKGAQKDRVKGDMKETLRKNLQQ